MIPSKPNRSSSRWVNSKFWRRSRTASTARSKTARSRLDEIGFSRKLKAPCCIASTALGTEAWPVTITTSQSGNSCFVRLKISMPSTSFITRSVTTTS